MRICANEGCEAEMKVAGYCSCCYKKLWRRGEAGHTLLEFDALKPKLRCVYRTLGTYSAVDRMCGLASGHTKALLHRSRRIHVRTAEQICTRLGLEFDSLFDREAA